MSQYLASASAFGFGLIWFVRSAAPSSIIFSSLLTAMNCQPSARAAKGVRR